ncbi:hypothetical protein ACFL3Q_00935 [Planctomycetota bacterium]
MTDNGAKTLAGDEKSLVEVRRKSTRLLDLRAFFMIWAIEPPRMLK